MVSSLSTTIYMVSQAWLALLCCLLATLRHYAITVDAAGVYNISVIAGMGSASGPIGDGGPVTSATLYYPYAVAVDKTSSNLYISDLFNHRVRKLSLSTGIITTFPGTGGTLAGMGAMRRVLN